MRSEFSWLADVCQAQRKKTTDGTAKKVETNPVGGQKESFRPSKGLLSAGKTNPVVGRFIVKCGAKGYPLAAFRRIFKVFSEARNRAFCAFLASKRTRFASFGHESRAPVALPYPANYKPTYRPATSGRKESVVKIFYHDIALLHAFGPPRLERETRGRLAQTFVFVQEYSSALLTKPKQNIVTTEKQNNLVTFATNFFKGI